jgi:hypothetical protein
MDVITFRCSACKQVLKVNAEKAGRKAKCTNCGAEVTVPSGSGKPEAPARKAPAAAGPKPAPPPAKVEQDDDGPAVYSFATEPEPPPSAEPKRRAVEDDEDDEEAEAGPRRKAARQRHPDDVDEDEEDYRRRDDEDEEEEAKFTRRRRNKPPEQPEKWAQVRVGILIVFVAICFLILANLLHWIICLIGVFTRHSYSAVVDQYASDKTKLLIGIISGPDSLDTTLTILRVSQVLVLLYGLVAVAGYGICVVVPNRHGTRGMAIALLSIGVVNLILAAVFRLLPLVGAMGYAMPPLVGAEVPMLDANMQRTDPLHVFWSGAPVVEVLMAILIQLLGYADLILFPVFLRGVTISLKGERLDETCMSLVMLALGQVFIQIAFPLLAVTGTSEVLLWVLRVVYVLGMCFFLGQLIWYLFILLQGRKLIASRLAGE